MEDDNDDGDVYEVEKIVDNVVVGGTTYYRVRWKNYNEDGDTWEPRENLLSCEDLLNTYIRVQSEKTSGLTLPGDVFTAGTGDSGSESEKDSKKKEKTTMVKIKEKKKLKESKKKHSKKIKPRSPSLSGSSSEEPQVKDPFWENLKDGKIDVFASDLYSKVKQRRPPGKETETAELTADISTKEKKRATKKNVDKNEEDILSDESTKVKQPAKQSKKILPDKISLSGDEKESNTDEEPNMVLQYLEKEIKSKKGKKKQKKKNKDTLPVSTELKQAEGRSFMNLFEESEAAAKPEKKQDQSISNIAEMITKPNIVLEKLNIPEKVDTTKKKDKEVQKETEVSKRTLKEKDDPAPPQKEEKRKEKGEKSAVEKKPSKGNTKEEISDIEMTYDSDISDTKVKVGKDGKQTKVVNRFQMVDAFSAQLQESDQAVTDLMMKKKTKRHRPHAPSPMHEKSSASPSQRPAPEKSCASPSATTSVLEMLTQEMERTVTMGTASVDPKLTPFEAAVKDAHSKLGLKPPSVPLGPTEKQQHRSCAPDMVEFLKIKVNFELDEISVKDIERHHEMGEPPCRLERDVTNAEFRQYIRLNNFEMVHEALKSKKMMYNLEHTDSNWMTQLMVAAAAGFDEIVKILSHHGARVNARSKIGQTALMFAAEKGHDIVCRVLIAYGAYINLQTTTAETALMKAAKNGHHMIVRYLLQAGADPTLKSPHGTTALEMTERLGHQALTELIKEHEMNITAHVNECIHRECHNLGIKTIGLPILATRVYNVRETPLIHATFNCVLQNVPPNQGLMLFALHGMIGSGLSIKCRMRGPCHINAVTLNNHVMDPMMPGKQVSDEYTHFITHLVWKGGQNSLRLFLSQDALSNEKLFISIYQCGFVE